MTHRLINKLIEPDTPQLELLMEAQLLIDQCNTWKKVAEIMLPCLRESPADLEAYLEYLYQQAALLVRKEKEEQCKIS